MDSQTQNKFKEHAFAIGATLVPWGRTALELVKVYGTIKEDVLIHRLNLFFSESELTEDEIKAVDKEMEDNPKAFAQKIMQTLERLDEDVKVAILGKLYKAHRCKALDVYTFWKLANIVDKIYLDDLRHFEEFYSTNEKIVAMCLAKFYEPKNEIKVRGIVEAGLLYEAEPLQGHGLPNPIKYSLSPFGTFYTQYVLDTPYKNNEAK